MTDEEIDQIIFLPGFSTAEKVTSVSGRGVGTDVVRRNIEALGGTVRVSQVQLVQPFMSMLFAVPLLGERLDLVTVGFGLAVIATVFIGKKMPVHSARHTATAKSMGLIKDAKLPDCR